MNSKKSLGGELFLRGADQYLDALTAIAAFRGEVQDMCTEVYKHHASELATLMGLEVEDCEAFDDNSPDERWAEVGVSRPAQKDCFFCLYLSWGEAERPCGTIAGTVSLDLYHKRLRDEIYERFRQNRSRCRVEKFDTYSLVLSQSLKNLASAQDALDALALEWLDCCKSIGGLKLRNRDTP
jgi:hypothetical protein